MLDRRRLHQVRGRPLERTRDAVVERQLDQADGVDHDAGGVRGVPHLKLELRIQRHITKGATLQANVRPLAVGQPRNVIRRSDVNILGTHVVIDLRRDSIRLRDLLRLETLTLQHVQEVRVAANVQLIRALEVNTTILEQRGEHAVRNRRANLALDVVANDRQASLLKALRPIRLARNEDGDVVDEGNAGGKSLLDVPLRCLLRTDREVRNDHIGLGVFEDLDDVGSLAWRLRDDLR